MDYEKKMTREEAIKIVRNIYQTDAEKEALATLIPELRESDDERIRKEIIHYILYKADGVSEEQEHTWIAYLEKQKGLFTEGPGHYFYDGDKAHFCSAPAMEVRELDDFNEPVEHWQYVGEVNLEEDKEKRCTCDESEYDRGYRDGHRFGLQQTEDYMIGKTFKGLIPCWVNAPSTSQSAHKYHGKNVVIMHENNGGFRCVCIDDDKPVTFHLPEDTLFAEGWRGRPSEKEKEQKLVEIKIDNPNIQKIDPDVKISTSDSSADGDEILNVKKSLLKSIQKSWYMEGYNDRDFNKEPRWIIKTGEGGPRYEENPKYGHLIEKKSSEWSEEDEGMLNCIIATLCEEEHGGRETNNKMVTWLDNRLKSLHPVKQEWSEEDEEHLKSIISTIEMCMMDCEDAKAVLGYYESDISWLKSLRPVSKESLQSWKPSEKPNIELIQRSWYMEGYNDCKFEKEPVWIISTGPGGPQYKLNPNREGGGSK